MLSDWESVNELFWNVLGGILQSENGLEPNSRKKWIADYLDERNYTGLRGKG